METNDSYRTLLKPSKGEVYKEKNSKFLGYAFPVTSKEGVKLHLEELKKEHYSARHWCYAYQIGTETVQYRANDDGEPNNSAGMPIYGQIQSFELTNILVVVIRYYGGAKLGVGGLINAYRTAAQQTLENAKVIEKTIDKHFQLKFDYKYMSKVMRILKENQVEISKQTLEHNCLFEISVRKGNSKSIFQILDAFFGVEINEL